MLFRPLMRKYFTLLKKAWGEFSEDKAQRLAAGLAYYTLFSIAPLLLIAIEHDGPGAALLKRKKRPSKE